MVAAFLQPRRQNLSIQERLIQIGMVDYRPLANAAGVDLKSYRSPNALPNLTPSASAPTQTTGPSNNLPYAANFAGGSSQSYTVADTPALAEVSKGMTIACWANMISGGSDRYLVSKYNPTGNLRAYRLFFNNATSQAAIGAVTAGDGTGAVTLSSGITFSTGTWYFIVAWWGGARLWIQINQNAPVSAAFAGPIPITTSSFDIGRLGSDTAFWNGQIAHVGVWSRVLSDAERFWLYNNGAGRNLTRQV